MCNVFTRYGGLRALIGTLIVALSAPVGAQEPEVVRKFAIPAQALSSALIEFSRQSDTMVVADPRQVDGLRSPEVDGQFTVSEALDKLLTGSGLRAQRREDGGVTLVSTTSSSNQITSTDNSTPITEILVTGSRIRGINRTLPLTVVDDNEIERSGIYSTDQILSTLPQNYAGGNSGPSEVGLFGGGNFAGVNRAGSTSPNLRGLGNESTLTLVNGHRVAGTAYGAISDISLLPLTAIERVEVLSEGASAIYGSDAVAGVVNFILKKEYDGAESRASFSGAEGGAEALTLNQLLGQTWTRGNALINVRHEERNALASTDRAISDTAERPTDLLPETETNSVFGLVRQEVTPSLEVFAELGGAEKTSDRNLAQFGVVSLNSTEVEQLQIASGVNWSLRDWIVALTGAFGSSEDLTRSVFSAGAPAGYENGSPRFINSYDIGTIDLVLNGGLFDWPTGSVRAAIGASYRDEEGRSQIPYLQNDLSNSRNVKAAFGEFYISLVNPEAGLRFMRRLDISPAFRCDEYSDFGSTCNPRVGVFFEPVQGLSFRSSWSESFLAPSAAQLAAVGQQFIFNFPFSSPGGGQETIFVLSGSDSQLDPQTSKNFNLGLQYSPAWANGLRIDLNYFRIDYQDQIIIPPFDINVLLNPQIYGSLLSALPNDEQAQAFLDAQIASGALFFDVTGSGAAGVRNVFNTRQQNAAKTKLDGFDVDVSYNIPLDRNKILLSLRGSQFGEILTYFAAGAIPADLLNTYGNPIENRIRALASFMAPSWDLTGVVNYAGSYKNTTTSPSSEIPSQTTLDVTFAYRFPALRSATLQLTATNVFDKQPPEVENPFFPGVNFDSANANPLGRVLAAQIIVAW